MKRRLASKLSTLLLLPALWPTLILAQTPRGAGIVTALSGQATVVRPTLPRPLPLKFKDDVFLRDRISTAEQSLVRVLLGGKALVTVRELSVLTIAEELGRATVNLGSGLIGMAVARQRMRPGETLEIHTPNAIAAVRGTVLVVEVTGAETAQLTATATLTTTVYVLSGSVDVSPLDAPSTSVRVGTLERVSVTGNKVGEILPVAPETVTQFHETLKAPPQHADTPKEGQAQVLQTQQLNATVIAEILSGSAPTPLITGDAESVAASSLLSQMLQGAPSSPPGSTPGATTSPPANQAPVVGTTEPTQEAREAVASGAALIIPPDRTINTNQTFSSASHGMTGVGGTLDGTGTVTVTGLYTWESGAMGGTGTTQANGGLAITGDVNLNRTLSNAGPGTIQGDFTIAGNGTFTNAGTVQKSAGGGTATISPVLNNAGTVDIQTGTLALSGGGTHTGTFSSTGTLQFGGGTHNLNAGAPLTGTGEVQVSSGTVNVNSGGVDRLTGTLSVTGGTLTVTGDLATPTTATSLAPTGRMLAVSSGDATVTRNVVTATGRDALIPTSTDPFVALSGIGTRALATDNGAAMFNLSGTATASQIIDLGPTLGLVTLTLGMDQPIHSGTVAAPAPLAAALLETTGATVSSAQALNIDTALLEATAPLVKALAGSTVTFTADAVNLANIAQLLSGVGVAFIQLDAASLTVNVGSLINVAGGSYLQVLGDLIRLSNGATLTLEHATAGFVLRASGGAVVDISGALIEFAGTGGNRILSGNTVAPTQTIFGIPVSLTGGATPSQVEITGTPIRGSGLGTIVNPAGGAFTGSLINIEGPNARVRIRGM